jgi:hypothetical protein
VRLEHLAPNDSNLRAMTSSLCLTLGAGFTLVSSAVGVSQDAMLVGILLMTLPVTAGLAASGGADDDLEDGPEVTDR